MCDRPARAGRGGHPVTDHRADPLLLAELRMKNRWIQKLRWENAALTEALRELLNVLRRVDTELEEHSSGCDSEFEMPCTCVVRDIEKMLAWAEKTSWGNREERQGAPS